MSTIVPHARLRAEVDTLADVVGSIGFGLATDARQDRTARRDHLLGMLHRYLEPRLAEPDHPVVVVVFGPTGSGKSTIVNTLVGRPISEVGVLRPTTRRAVAWVDHRHVPFVETVIAPTGPLEVVEDTHPVLGALAIVDTPDIDSVAEDHRRQTTAILESADVAIAVTTPQRYADAVPWEVLGELTERSLDVIVVMNRTTRRAAGAVIDLASLLRDARVRGIDSADDIIVIQEQRVRADGRLHGYALRHLARRLESLAADQDAISLRGLISAARHAVAVGQELSDAVIEQTAEGRDLAGVINEAVAAQTEAIADRVANGELVRGEVVARWQRMVGVSDLAEVVGRGLSKLRDLTLGRRVLVEDRVEAVDREVHAEMVALGLRRAEHACTTIELSWSLSAAGSALLEEVDVDWARIRAALDDSIADWQSEVIELVAGTGRSRYRLARVATVGINAAGTLLLLGVFATTGGITGTEMGVAAGAAAAQQTVLERLFGSATARSLTRSAQSLLTERLGRAVVSATDRYRAVLENAVDDPDSARMLEESCADLEAALEDYSRG